MKLFDFFTVHEKACVQFGYTQGMGLKQGDELYDKYHQLVLDTRKQLVGAIARRIEQERSSTLSLDEMDCEPCVKMFRD